MEPHGPPAVSVLIPCYNLGEFVTEAVDSVFSQTRQDFEIIVVNDGSTDAATNRVLGRLNRPRTKVVTTENRGLPAARNLALQHASAPYVCALDADDVLEPRFLEKTLAILDADPSITFVSTWLECFGEEHWIWRQERCDFPRLLAECVVLTASPVRREALASVGGYDVDFSEGHEDWDLWISLVERGHRGTIVPEVLFRYRQRPGSMRRRCDEPDVRNRLWRRLVTKHQQAYARYAPEVLLDKEEECGRLLRQNRDLERDLETRLQPTLAARRAELTRLAETPTIADARETPDSHRDALEAALAEIAAVRASKSWRLTAPLRRGLDAWLAIRRWWSSARVAE